MSQSGDFISNEYNKYSGVNKDANGNNVTIIKSEAPTLIDVVSDTEIYLGWAIAGTSSNDHQWKIKQIKQTGSVWTQKFPNGDENFFYSWTDRSSLIYS